MFQFRPFGRVHLLSKVLGGQLCDAAQFGVELRFDTADGHKLAVRRFVDLIKVGAGIEHMGAAILGEHTLGLEAIEHGHEGSGAFHHGAVDHLAFAGALGFQSGTDHAEGQHHAATAEITHQVQGNGGFFSLAAHGMKRPGQGDVVHVVAGGLGQRACLAPTGHAAINQFGVTGQALFRANA